MNYRVLITGGAGFIGSHTADALIEQGHQVRILDILHPTVHPKGKPDYLNPEAEFIKGDVREKKAWETALKGIDVIYHFAAYQDYLTDFSTFFNVNAGSTALMYEVLLEKKWASRIKKIIVAASQAVMGEGKYQCLSCFPKTGIFEYPSIRQESALSRGEWEHRCPVCRRVLQWIPSDESVANPGNPYALSKHSQEQIAVWLGRRYDIPSVVLRYSIVQGPRQSFHNAYSGAMRIFSLSLLFNKSPIIFEDGKQVRDFINIKDVVSANLMMLKKEEVNGKIFNVGGGTAWAVIDFYQTMQHTLNRWVRPVISRYYRFGDTRHIVSDITAMNRLGWFPKEDIRESITGYWEYINTPKATKEILETANRRMKLQQVIRKTRKDPEGHP
ncbi:MAG: NAD-dependent epimerase/dehydratase family protein [Thermodesulfobacteriota bacterium]